MPMVRLSYQPPAATIRIFFPWSILYCTVRMCWSISGTPNSSDRLAVNVIRNCIQSSSFERRKHSKEIHDLSIAKKKKLPDPKSQTIGWCRMLWLVCWGCDVLDVLRKFCTHLPCIHWRFRNQSTYAFLAVRPAVPTKLCATFLRVFDQSQAWPAKLFQKKTEMFV